MPSFTDTLRARAKALWPDEKGLYCYVRNGEYDAAFESGVFPREIALTRQAEYKAGVASKFAEVNGDSRPKNSPICLMCKRAAYVSLVEGTERLLHRDDHTPAGLRCSQGADVLPAPIPDSPVEIREESKPVRDYSINPKTGGKRKPKPAPYRPYVTRTAPQPAQAEQSISEVMDEMREGL